MQHDKVPTSIRIALVAGGITLLAGACAAATVPSADQPTATVAPAEQTTATIAPADDPVVATAGSDDTGDDIDTEPDTGGETSPPDPDEPESPVEPADVPEAAEPAAPCDEYGPLPGLPDSMPTHLYDTDGDGADDDEVTAYGAVDGWRIRVVQNGVTSESLVDDIAGWAYLDDPIATEAGDRIVLVEPDTDLTRHFATDAQGCVQPFATDVVIDDLVAPSDPEPPVVIDDFAAPDEMLGCGGLAPIPDDAIIASEMWRDIDDDGFAEERIVSYFDGTWKLRGEIPEWGLSSELEIPGAGPHGVRVIGFADVDLTYGGDEILAVVGGGASAVEVGVFSFLEGYCMFRYQLEGGEDFGLLTGASVMWGEGVTCVDGLMVDWGYQREEDDTYTAWSAAYQPVSLGVFGYVPASDGFAEGLTLDEVDGDLFDCHGLTI